VLSTYDGSGGLDKGAFSCPLMLLDEGFLTLPKLTLINMEISIRPPNT
jgi:hypothetical protein